MKTAEMQLLCGVDVVGRTNVARLGLEADINTRETINHLWNGVFKRELLYSDVPVTVAELVAANNERREKQELAHEVPQHVVAQIDEQVLYEITDQKEQSLRASRRGKYIKRALRGLAATGIALGLGLAAEKMGANTVENFIHPTDPSPINVVMQTVWNATETVAIGASTLCAPLLPLVYKKGKHHRRNSYSG